MVERDLGSWLCLDLGYNVWYDSPNSGALDSETQTPLPTASGTYLPTYNVGTVKT